MLDLETGCVYRVEFRCRDIGHGVEEGVGVFICWGRLPDGKIILEPTIMHSGPTLYLFDDEVTEAKRKRVL